MLQEADIRRLLQKHERRIGRLFVLAMQEYRGSLNLGVLENLLRTGHILDALREIENIALATANASQAAFLEAATATADYIQRGAIATIGFDHTNQRTIALLTRNRLLFIQQFTAQQTRTTRSALIAGLREGLAPRAMARTFRDSIGLTEYQNNAVANYKRLLHRIGQIDSPKRAQMEAFTRELRDKRHDPRMLRAFRDEKPLKVSEVDRMVSRYRERYIKYRAENIARSEALHSVHAGQDAAMDEAYDSGALDRDEMEDQWKTATDGRERDAHAELHLVKKHPSVPFTNSEGEIWYPGDRRASAANTINCRCIKIVRFKK